MFLSKYSSPCVQHYRGQIKMCVSVHYKALPPMEAAIVYSTGMGLYVFLLEPPSPGSGSHGHSACFVMDAKKEEKGPFSRPSKCPKLYANRILGEQNLRQKVRKFC